MSVYFENKIWDNVEMLNVEMHLSNQAIYLFTIYQNLWFYLPSFQKKKVNLFKS